MSNRRCSVDGCRGWAFQNGLCCQHKKETKDEILEKKFAERNDEIGMSSVLYPMQWLDWFRQWRQCGSAPTDFKLLTLFTQSDGITKWQQTTQSFGPGSTWKVTSASLKPFGTQARDLPQTSPHPQLIIVMGGQFTFWASDHSFQVGSPGSLFFLTDTWGQGHTFAAQADQNLYLSIEVSSSTLCSSSPSDSSASSNSSNSDTFSSSSSPSASSSFSTSSPTTDPDPTTTSTFS